MGSNPAIRPRPEDVLIVVDVQNDFCPGGRLAVQKGDEVVPLVNALAQRFANVVLTQDWHPPGHQSFATSHPGRKPFDSIKLPYGEQVLWPDHCVQGSDGAALHKDLSVPQAQRSEEHTSELQSRPHLVCRLLLEKKKKKKCG